MKIGVLALQGAFEEHARSISNLGMEAVIVKLPQHLEGLDALIIPGGESTTISKLLSDYSLDDPIKALVKEGMPVLGTCAGMILLARDVVDDNKVPTLDIMDIGVRRNAYGRQVDSFEAEMDIPRLGNRKFHGVFIRAPVIEYIKPGVEVLCELDGRAVAIKQGKVIACTFHPELTEDLRFHEYFIELARGDGIATGNNR